MASRKEEFIAGVLKRNPTTWFKGYDLVDSGARRFIHNLRTEGYPIIASHKGYKWAQSEEELLEYINSLESRVDSIINVINGLRDSKKEVE